MTGSRTRRQNLALLCDRTGVEVALSGSHPSEIPVWMAGNERKPWKTRGLCASLVPYTGVHLGNPGSVVITRVCRLEVTICDLKLGRSPKRSLCLQRPRSGNALECPSEQAGGSGNRRDHANIRPSPGNAIQPQGPCPQARTPGKEI